jgi:hypothetical protein
MKNKMKKIPAVLIVMLSLLMSNAATALGEPVYTNTRLLADNLELINTVKWDTTLGRTESFALKMTGVGDAYPIVMNGDTVYGG